MRVHPPWPALPPRERRAVPAAEGRHGQTAERRATTRHDKPAESGTKVSGSSTARRRSTSAPTADKPALLTTTEAAVLLHVHPRTVQRLVDRGQLCAVHLGSAVRFDPRDVD